MNRKEWLEVSKQSLYFVLAAAGMIMLAGIVGLVDGNPLDGEKIFIMLGLWLLMFSMFLGLSPFALDSEQRGMEYLLTLPFSRRRLLFIKLLPRLAAAVLFYLIFVLSYTSFGHDAFAGGFAFFSLTYFALFLISFSLALVHDNFIVQSIWTAIVLCGYLALGLSICALGSFWKWGMPVSWTAPGLWRDLAYDVPGLITAVAVFFLLAAPFVISLFLAFKKYDLKPSRAFNRRQLLLFIPLLLLALAISLGVAYLVQRGGGEDFASVHILGNRQLLRAGFPGKLDLYGTDGRHRVKVGGVVVWGWLLREAGGQLFLSGYDARGESRFIGSLTLADLSWKVLHRCPDRYFVAQGPADFRYDGEQFVYLKRTRAEAERPGPGHDPFVRTDDLQLVRFDPVSGQTRVIAFHSALFRKYFQPRLIGSDERQGLRFWLAANKWSRVLRLWEDGRVEDLGFSAEFPAYFGDLLFTTGDHSLRVCKLLDNGIETVAEIEGQFHSLGESVNHSLETGAVTEIYAERGTQIVRIDLKTLVVSAIGPKKGYLCFASPGGFYYVESRSQPNVKSKKWRRVYRLKDGKMIFLKQFGPLGPGLGSVRIEEHGIIFSDQHRLRVFAFPDLRELGFNLDKI